MRTLTIALSAVCVAALAVTVPQASIDDYFFSRPNCTNLTGTVIGEPPAYTTLRREDIAWLREAAAERAALQSRSWNGLPISIKTVPNKIGSFPLSSSNTFSRYVTAKEWVSGSLQTNIVVGYNSVTNMGSGIDVVRLAPNSQIDIASGLSFGSGFSGYLSSNFLQGSACQVGNLPSHTNIITNVTTSYPSYYWDDNLNYVDNTTQHVEVITMQMTNGTVSAWTNSWRVPLPRVETLATTNISDGNAYDLLFTGRELKTYDVAKPKAFSGIPTYSAVREYYDWLRGMNVLAENVSNTNKLPSIVYRWRYDLDDGQWHMRPETRTVDTSEVGLFAIGVGIDIIAEGYEAGNGRMVFPTKFRWDVVHTGGVCRIASADLYACVSAHFESYDSGYHSRNGTFVRRIGSASKIATPQGGYVCYEASVDGPSIAREGASACGCPVRSVWKDWGDDIAYYSVSFFLVYHMAPWASLPGWGNQQGEPSP